VKYIVVPVAIIKKSNSKLYEKIFTEENNFSELVIIPVKYQQNLKSFLILFYTEIKRTCYYSGKISTKSKVFLKID